MEWVLSPFAVLVFGSALLAIGVSVEAFRQRPDPMALPLTVLFVAVSLWSIPYAISLGYTDVERVVFWYRLRYPATSLVPVAYFVVALTFAGYDQWLSRRVYAVLAIVPAITLAVVWTNPSHGLFWRSTSVATVAGGSVVTPEVGPWFLLHVGYSYLLATVGLVVLGAVVVRSGPLYRKQAALIFVGGAVPLGANIAANFWASGSMVDLTAPAFAVSGVLFVLGLFHFDTLDLSPVARTLLFDELDDGVVVVGPRDCVQDFNRTATHVLDGLALGQPATPILEAAGVSDGGELVVPVDGEQRQFRARSTVLTDGKNREIGQIIYLNDVTEIIEREQRISVLNRILRHNIRNEMNVASGHLELLAEGASEDDLVHVEHATQRVQRVVEFAEKARRVEQTIRSADEVVTVSPVAVSRQVIDDARSRFADASFELDVPEDADKSVPDVCVVDANLFERSIAELIENAVTHTDRIPQVTLGIEIEADRVTLSIADNGPGIPAIEADIAAAQLETQLDHGSGLGLWLVRWIASLSSATLSFEANEPRGTVATLTLRPDPEAVR